MKKEFWIGTMGVLLALLSFGYSFYLNDKNKIAYVRSSEVLEQYKGMKYAHSLVEQNNSALRIKIDSIKIEYDKIMTSIKKEQEKAQQANNYFEKEITLLQEEFKNKNQNLVKVQLDKINTYIEKYSDSNGYKLVLGVATGGNILYGQKALDITEEITKGLNNE